ncbi:MAG: inositol monophosphatase [Chloroflexi bacterium]|nr:inositol monophosphatase [Chloroflexota bacterium]
MSTSLPAAGVDPALLLALEARATTLARDAGALLLEWFRRPQTVEYKSRGHRDPVSEADRKADELLQAGIRRHFPDHGILSEEAPPAIEPEREFLWVLDPLDGTANFVAGCPFYGVSIGVLYRGTPVVGALFVPSPGSAPGQVLHARLGGGAFADDTPLFVSPSERPDPSGLVGIPGSLRHYFRVGRGLARLLGQPRVTGSVAYELALAASGVFQASVLAGARVWDVAGGIVVVREAGGEVLVRKTKPQRWEPLRSFLEPAAAGLPAGGGLRDWRAHLIAGNPSIVAMVARDLRPRSPFRRWLRRLRRRLFSTPAARERTARAPEEERHPPPTAPPGAGQTPLPRSP